MKVVVALYLLAVICAASSSDLWENHMKYEKQISVMNVDYAKQILQYAKDKAQRDYKTEAKNKFNEQNTKYMEKRNSTIDAIYAKVEDAKGEGKDVQICYDNFRENIFGISIEARNNGLQCIKSGEESVKDKLVFIEEHIKKAILLREKLNQRNSDMHNPHIEETELRDQAMENRKSVKELQNVVKIVTTIANSTSKIALLDNTICLDHVVYDAQIKINNVQWHASKCIEAI